MALVLILMLPCSLLLWILFKSLQRYFLSFTPVQPSLPVQPAETIPPIQPAARIQSITPVKPTNEKSDFVMSTTTISFAQLRDSALDAGVWRPLPSSPDFSSAKGHSTALKNVINCADSTETSSEDELYENPQLSKKTIDGSGLYRSVKPKTILRTPSPCSSDSEVYHRRAIPDVQIRAPDSIDAHDHAATRLRYTIKHSPEILTCPGVYDGLSARIATSMGFSGLYMTGAGTTASRLGAADLGLAQLHDMRTNAEMIANLAPDGPPLIADMDTGYGGPMVISRAVTQYVLAGVAGFHIEDQVLQKRCGHLQGKEVVDMDTYLQRIRACRLTADRLRSDIVIIARTDALQSLGYAECVRRLRAARDEGADMGILEGCQSKAQAAQAVLDLAPWPLCLNSVENGVSPLITVQDAQEMGYRAIIFSFATISPAYAAIKQTLQRLQESGVTGSKVTPKEIFDVCGLRESMVIDEAAGGSAFAKGV